MRKTINIDGSKFTMCDENMKESDIDYADIIGMSISKNEVENKKFDRAFKSLAMLEKMGKKARKKLVITFEYDDVSDEIYEIKAIREWMEHLFKEYPHLLYFIEYNFFNNANVLMACLSDVEMVKIKGSTDVMLKIEMDERLYMHLFKATAMYSLYTLEDTQKNTDDILTTFRKVMIKK